MTSDRARVRDASGPARSRRQVLRAAVESAGGGPAHCGRSPSRCRGGGPRRADEGRGGGPGARRGGGVGGGTRPGASGSRDNNLRRGGGQFREEDGVAAPSPEPVDDAEASR